MNMKNVPSETGVSVNALLVGVWDPDVPGSGSVSEASETDAPEAASLASGASYWTPVSATSPIISFIL